MNQENDRLIQFRAGDMTYHIACRGPSRNATAKRDLGRYYQLLEKWLATLNLTLPEAAVLAESLKHDLPDWRSTDSLGLIIEQRVFDSPTTATSRFMSAIQRCNEPGISNGERFERRNLLAKVSSFTPCQTFALLESVERYIFSLVRYVEEQFRSLGIGFYLSLVHLWGVQMDEPQLWRRLHQLGEQDWYKSVSALAVP